MLKIGIESLPKPVMYKLSYIVYYSIISYICIFFFFLALAVYKIGTPMTDYQLFCGPLALAVPIGFIVSIVITPIEKKTIKRNVFLAGLITILRKHKSITFKKIVENYSYLIFQSKKVVAYHTEFAYYIEALIALGIIELNNHKELKPKLKDFDYNVFFKNFDDIEISLKDKNIIIDDLIKRIDNYIL